MRIDRRDFDDDKAFANAIVRVRAVARATAGTSGYSAFEITWSGSDRTWVEEMVNLLEESHGPDCQLIQHRPPNPDDPSHPPMKWMCVSGCGYGAAKRR